MILMFGKQCESRLEEHIDNIAIVVLGTTDISEEDEEYIKVSSLSPGLRSTLTTLQFLCWEPQISRKRMKSTSR
jgi:homoserine kinase